MTFRDGLAATRDRALLAMRAVAGATAGRMLWLSGLLAVIILAVIWWPELRERFTPRYNGQIIVNSPAVYTRQRLVNDRLSQSAWLQEQLRVTTREFDSAFRSIDEVRSIRNSSSIRGQVAVGTGGAGGAAPSPASPPVDDSKNDPVVPTVQPTSTDLFRAKNTYREEVRAEIMETQLDDRHDIQGNTVYRLSFDATVLPGTRADALAVIKVKLLHDESQFDDKETPLDREYFELYEDWLRFMQKVVQKSIGAITQNVFDRTPDRIANALPSFLLKRICEYSHVRRGEAACDPGADPSNPSQELRETSKRISDYVAAHLAARTARFKEQLKLNIAAAAKEKGASPDLFNYALDESYQFCEQTQKNEFPKTPRGPGEVILVKCPATNAPTEGLIAAANLYEALARRLPNTVEEAQQLFSDRLTGIKSRCTGNEAATCNLPDTTKDALRCLVADHMWSQLNLHDRSGQSFSFSSNHRFDTYFKVQLVGRETGNCNVVFLTAERSYTEGRDDPIKQMMDDLNRDVEIYAYSVTPKNLAQRLSTTSDTRDAIQALLNANFGAGGRDVSSLIETLQKKSTQSQAIQALPIVIGYGLTPPIEKKKHYTEFGWVIAPQIKIGTQGERSHSDRQYALAAVVSVPSWWRSMNLAIEACWVERADLHKLKTFGNCGPETESPAKHTVRLPGVISELSRKLGFEFVQEPWLDYRYPADAPLKLEVGRPAQVLLMGGRIWRSTEVTLGAQKADEITVLPNMEGILAKFGCVRRQYGDKAVGDTVPIRVWTSEGVTEPPENALLVEPADQPKGSKPVICPDENQELRAHTTPIKEADKR